MDSTEHWWAARQRVGAIRVTCRYGALVGPGAARQRCNHLVPRYLGAPLTSPRFLSTADPSLLSGHLGAVVSNRRPAPDAA